MVNLRFIPREDLVEEIQSRYAPNFRAVAGGAEASFPVELVNMYLNKGTAFSQSEREQFKILGLVPPVQESLEQQAARAIKHVHSYTTMMNRYIYMEKLHSLNVRLFYKVLLDNVVDLLPVVYTPTVGEACERFGANFRDMAGLYLSVHERGSFRATLDNWHETPEIIVVTDGGRILGLGDLGAGGMGIPIGKLHLYVAGGGFHPSKTLPITIDVGCDRESVITGQEHEAIMDEFMQAVSDKWPECIIQFEDFQSEYALKYLEKYRRKYIHFNDDVQGTAAVVTAGFINGMKAQGTSLRDAKVVMYGAGSSAVGVSKYLMKSMVVAGLSEEEARNRIYMVDSKGLITTTRGDKLNEWKQQFARVDGAPDMTKLEDIVEFVRPHALFGLTGAGPSFSKAVVETMCAHCPQPMIFPLSNPTSKAEITIEQAAEWSRGKCIFAAGSPFQTLTVDGRTVHASQCNNMLIFPGVGMGAKLSKASRITDSMLVAAAYAVADYVHLEDIQQGKLYPDLKHLRDIGVKIATAVWAQAVSDGVSQMDMPAENAEDFVRKQFYTPSYNECSQVAESSDCAVSSKVDLPLHLLNPLTNQGSNYSYAQRLGRGMVGLVPPAVETLSQQVRRAIAHVRGYTKPINKYVYLEQLRSSNATLFYKVLLEHVVELLPCIYTPTVGEACQKFGEIFRNNAGMYLALEHKGKLRAMLDNWPHTPDIIVVTDGGRILGLGDLGVGGMGIPIGKLHLYCAGGGFDPSSTLPIQLDLGCDTAAVVTDPHYLGTRMPRLKGKEHEEFVDEFMQAVSDKWPECIIQFEDFQSEYALKYLEKYRRKYIHFNDDVQGTAAVVTAGFINGMKAQGTELTDAKIVMFGAGSSAVGVATYLCKAMVMAGLSKEEARNRIFMIDSKGLITTTRGDQLNEWKQQFARVDGAPDITKLVDVVRHVKPNALFGLTGAGPSFDREVVEALCDGCPKPLIFPLSNPTCKAEITIEQAVEYSKGNLLFAAGSPFPNSEYEGKTVYASQCNNMLIFPGVGMGCHLSKATTITDAMMIQSAFTVANFVSAEDIKMGKLYPDLKFLRTIGKEITLAVWQKAHEEGVAVVPPPVNVRKAIEDAFYKPKYDTSPF